MTQHNPEFPKLITGPDASYMLADSIEEAQAAYDPEPVPMKDVGWMCRVPYPEDYQDREDWEASPDFTDEWWEGCQAPVNDKQRAHVKRAFKILRRCL